MKEEIAMMWADALESGKYEQGRLKLKTADNKYCCLGVLCELSGLGEWNGDLYYHSETDSASATLTDTVQEWAGAKSVWGSWGTRSTDGGGRLSNQDLSFLNDTGKTFTEIAAIIRDNWKDL